MPRFDFIKNTKIKNSFRVSKVREAFDLPPESETSARWQGSIDCEGIDWNIGLILGFSGSGKTSIGKNIFKPAYHEGYSWGNENSVLDDFDSKLKTSDVISALSMVGFSSPPLWLLPYGSLSTGQKFRVEMARMILDEKEIMILDEFTSTIDRDVAKIGCVAISKCVKKIQKKRIFISCHFDIVDWLAPDWIFDTRDNKFTVTRGLLQRPKINIEIRNCKRSMWKFFKKNHYLSGDLSKSATCFVATRNNVPVGFTSYIHFPHQTVVNFKREHRTVVLPDYQGVGIAVKMVDEIAAYCVANKFRFITQTTHPARIIGLLKSPKWKCTSKAKFNVRPRGDFKKVFSLRKKMSFEYIGAQ